MRRWAGLVRDPPFRRPVRRRSLPGSGGSAPLHGCRPSDDAELTSYDEFAYSFTYAIAGLPAASVPAGGERGLPIGVRSSRTRFATMSRWPSPGRSNGTSRTRYRRCRRYRPSRIRQPRGRGWATRTAASASARRSMWKTGGNEKLAADDRVEPLAAPRDGVGLTANAVQRQKRHVADERSVASNSRRVPPA